MYDEEAIYQDADIEAAEWEVRGNEHWARVDQVTKLQKADRPADAAKLCSHSAGYGLVGTHAVQVKDSAYGKAVFRCTYCGAALDREPWDNPRIISIDLSTIIHEG